MAKKPTSRFTESERYLLDVQQRRDMAEIYPDGREGQWLRERERLAAVNPDGPEARQIDEENRRAKLYADSPEGSRLQEQTMTKENPKDVTPEQKANVDKALADAQLSDKIGGAANVGDKPAPNDPTPLDKSREVGQDLQRHSVTMDKE